MCAHRFLGSSVAGCLSLLVLATLALSLSSPPAAAGSEEGLVAAYPLNKGEGSVANDPVGGNDGTIVGAKWAAPGVFGKALEFDGSGDCLSASFSSAPGIGTFEAWIHPDTTETWPLVSSPGTEYPSDFLISGASTGLDLFSLAENTAGFTEAGVEASIPESTWTHIAFTNGEAPTFYVDGSPLELKPLPTLSPTGWNLEFACSPSLGSFDGLIDEIRVYDRALSQGEVEEDMETPIAGGPTALPSVIESNTTLTAVNSPYEAAAPVTVVEGVTLTVEPGVTVKSPGLSVDGTLKAEGTAEEPIIFTSLADSGPGEWEGIELNSGTSALEHVEVRNATTAFRSSGAIAPTIKESTIKSSSETAILLTGSDAKVLDSTLLSNHAGIGAFGGGSPVIDGNTIKNCGAGDFAIYYEGGSEASGEVAITDNEVEDCGAPVTDPPLPASYPAIGVYGSGGATIVGKSVAGNTIKSGGRALDYFVQGSASSIPPDIVENTITGNEADAIWVGGDVAETTTWEDNGFPVVFRTGYGLSVDSGVTLELGPGLVLKGEVDGGIEVEGELISAGAPGSPVTVTSIRDDSVGGDINADGSETIPAAGDWSSIRFAEGTSERPQGRGELLRIHVRFGGEVSTCEEGYFTGDVCEAMVALYPPVKPAVEPSILEHSRFEFSATEGLGGRSVSPEVADNVFSFNSVGMRLTKGGGPTISGNDVTDCAVDKPGIAYRSSNDGGAIQINGNLVERCGLSESAELSSDDVAGIEVVEPESEATFAEGPSEGNVIGISLSANTVREGGRAISYEVANGTIPPDIDENTVSMNRSNALWVGGELEESASWEDRGFPIVVFGWPYNLGVGGEAVLDLDPGLVVKMERDSAGIDVAGVLIAEGNPAEPVVFTAFRDDSIGGDTNGDSTASLPSSGDWASVEGRRSVGYEGKEVIGEDPGRLVLDQVVARFGGSSGPMIGLHDFDEDTPATNISRIEHTRLTRANGLAIELTGEFDKPELPKVQWNNFSKNGTAINNEAPEEVKVPHNDFGSPSGPKPMGTGDKVEGNIDPNPFTASPSDDGECRGEDTQCPEDGDPVSLATGQLNDQHRDLLLTNVSARPLEFTRAYNSGDTADSGLGIGWSTTALMAAFEQEGGNVLIRWPDGHEDLYTLSEGSYEPPSGDTDQLVKDEESGTYELTSLDETVYRFDASGRISSIVDRRGLETTYAYDADGRLESITDPSGQSLTFEYEADNRISKVTDSTGREVSFEYSEDGELETVTDPLEGVTKYGYDAEHRLTTITDPRDIVILQNTYDGQGRVVEQLDGLENHWGIEYEEGETVVTEPEGGEITHGFDAQNRRIFETDQLGRTTTTSYNAAGMVEEIVRPGGAKWSFGYDGAGNLTSVIDPEEGERSYEYDGQDRLTSFTDEREEQWQYEWNEDDDLVKVTDPVEGDTTFTHNEAGLPLTVTDPDENTTTFTYDSRGNRLSVEDALEHTTTFAYDEYNHLTSETKPGLEPEEFGRNPLGDLTARTTPEGNTTDYVYDANGMVVEVIEPEEAVWLIVRDAMERPTFYVDPLERPTSISYDGNLNISSVTDRRGKETTYEYDAANQLTDVVEPEGGDWEYGYDVRGNRTEVVEPRENATSYEFDLADRMTKVTEPLEAVTSYEYDAGGNLTSVIDPLEHATEFTYDEVGRLTYMDQPLGKATSYSYDPAGLPTSRTTAEGTVSFDYDAAGRFRGIGVGEVPLRSFDYDDANRMIEAVDAQEDALQVGYDDDGRVVSIDNGRGETASREYDSRGNLVEQVDGRGTLEYGYDQLGLMTSMVDPEGKELFFGYDPEGNLTEAELPNGVKTTNEYDDAGRLVVMTSKLAETVLESLEYDYDDAGNRVEQVDRLSQNTSYGYDAQGRLNEFDPPGEGSTEYGYDPAGNRTKAGATTFSFNALGQLTEDSAGRSYQYDGAGRLIEVEGVEEATTTYDWTALDELAGVEGGEVDVSYAYDALGRQVSRVDGEMSRSTHYGDLSDLPTLETNAEGKPVQSYVQGGWGLAEQRAGASTSFPLRDAHGDVTTLLDDEGEVSSRQAYDPWGSQLSGPALEMGWLGAQQRGSDPATGIVQMGARPYAPTLGTFLAEDPVFGVLGSGKSLNHYSYAWNEPVTTYDLSGQFIDLELPGNPICILGCAPEVPEQVGRYVNDRGRAFLKLAPTLGECLYEGLLNGSYESPCRDTFEEIGEELRKSFKEFGEGLDPEEPDDPPRLPPPPPIPGGGGRPSPVP